MISLDPGVQNPEKTKVWTPLALENLGDFKFCKQEEGYRRLLLLDCEHGGIGTGTRTFWAVGGESFVGIHIPKPSTGGMSILCATMLFKLWNKCFWFEYTLHSNPVVGPSYNIVRNCEDSLNAKYYSSTCRLLSLLPCSVMLYSCIIVRRSTVSTVTCFTLARREGRNVTVNSARLSRGMLRAAVILMAMKSLAANFGRNGRTCATTKVYRLLSCTIWSPRKGTFCACFSQCKGLFVVLRHVHMLQICLQIKANNTGATTCTRLAYNFSCILN